MPTERPTRKGVMQFVAGTGTASHYKFRNPKPTSKARITGAHGVLRLQLTEQAYAWKFTAAREVRSSTAGTASAIERAVQLRNTRTASLEVGVS